MTKRRDNALCFVQFIHPGGEHRPDDGQFKAWNRGDHKRKFLLSPGRCVRRSEVIDTTLVFWGEWEPESEVVPRIARPLARGPRYLYRPFYVLPHSYKGLQNTDPFVFGGFFYGNCQQYRNARPTQLRYLERGSVILFGSCVSGQFVLDTVFVIRAWIDHNRGSYRSVVNDRVPLGYMDVALNPLYLSGFGGQEGCPPDSSRSYRLYFGATHATPFDGMFSFFPCLPLEDGSVGFARPIIKDSRFITSNLRQGHRLNRQAGRAHIRDFWQSVVEQVLARGSWLGIQAQMPERRRVER